MEDLREVVRAEKRATSDEDRTDAIRAVEGVGMDAVIEPAETYGWIRRALERYDEPREEEWPPKKHAINPW